ncbi:GNAT family N-acetyltransferase [Mycolicibacterium peregrinum]|uniref:GNAT family N-acetyltransferase n=1 Tax=Mycolicibacterium peregrinum TaxID=43304 RepID=UPI0009EEE9A8|nr:GNAT family protein [Mycolicibacterium peregrinum]
MTIRPAMVEELRNALDDRQALEAVIGPVPDGWPETSDMFTYVIERLAEHPEEVDWRVYFFFDGDGVLVGSGGFQGPPDKDRAVEIGYEIAPSFQQRGLGTAAVSALVEQVRRSGAVGTVIARTATELNPSVRILKHLGFSNTGLAKAPDSDDDVWQWQLDV